MSKFISSKKREEESTFLDGLSLELSEDDNLKVFFDTLYKEYGRNLSNYEKKLKQVERKYSTIKMPFFHKLCDLLKKNNLSFSNGGDTSRKNIIIRNRVSVGDLLESIRIINNNTGNNILNESNYIIDATDTNDSHIYIRIQKSIKNSSNLKKSEIERLTVELEKSNKYLDELSLELSKLERRLFKTKNIREKINIKRKTIEKQKAAIKDFSYRRDKCKIDIRSLDLLMVLFSQEKDTFVNSVKELTDRMLIRKRIEEAKLRDPYDIKEEIILSTFNDLISEGKLSDEDINYALNRLKEIYKKWDNGEYKKGSHSINDFEYLTMCSILLKSKNNLENTNNLAPIIDSFAEHSKPKRF